jgi:CheY-like chemotaxis protein
MPHDGTQKKKILLIDSDETQLAVAESFLKNEYEVYETKSEQEAIQHIINTKCRLDLIIVDTVNPTIIGREFFNIIKGIGILQNIPVAFLTQPGKIQHDEPELIAPTITKPYIEPELQKTIKALLK